MHGAPSPVSDLDLSVASARNWPQAAPPIVSCWSGEAGRALKSTYARGCPCGTTISVHFRHCRESAIVTTELRLPELGMVVGTRAMLAAGVALLVADRLSADTRRGIGWALVGIGVVTTIPLARLVFGKRRRLA
jgi:hypothetical protein